jgi:NAD(P)-dependent dehydrogenase (short-subunit alcohol dehydrogenase family)
MDTIDGRVVVVTGAARGIGRAHALEFARNGYRVVVNDLGAEVDGSGSSDGPAGQVVEEIRAMGGEAVANGDDVADWDGARHLVELAVEHFGDLHVLVNNAGTDFIQPAVDYRVEDWHEILDVNLSGYFHCAQLAARHMLANGGGSIIMNSSIASTVGVHGLLGYGAAKGAINQLVRTMAVEWAQQGVRVNAIAPGYMENIMATAGEEHARTEKQQQVITFTPMGRRGRPDELGGPVVFLASDASSYVTGHVLYVDGGYTAM